MSEKLQKRRVGAYWRLLVHGLPRTGQKMMGPSHRWARHD